MEIIGRLNAKKEELKKLLSALYSGGSQRGGNLKHRIKRINDLIEAYEATTSSVNLSEAEEIFNQQVGFEEQKRKILEVLETAEFRESRNIQKSPLIFCFIGPTGVGKTTFAQILAQALNKKIFSVALGGLSDSSILVGTSESSSGTEIGQLAKSLVETKTRDPLILLDEIDKSGSPFKTSIQDCLLNFLDTAQNQEVLDHYLDVKLDFSQVSFVVTANDPKKIPKQLLSRMLVIELPGYNLEQKKEIANKFIEKWFDQNRILDQNNFEITSEALENLINKTKEKGVRQLRMALDNIFDYCLLQRAREARRGESENKIVVNSGLLNQIIPHDFFNIDQDDNLEKEENNNKKIEILQKELERLREERNNQSQLKTIKFNALLVLRQTKENFNVQEYYDYEGKINTSSSREEIEVIEKEILLKIKQKFSSPIPEKKQVQLTKHERLINSLKERLRKLQQLSNSEIKDLKKEIKNLQEKKKINWNIEGNVWFFLFAIIVISWIIYSIFGLRKIMGEQNKKINE